LLPKEESWARALATAGDIHDVKYGQEASYESQATETQRLYRFFCELHNAHGGAHFAIDVLSDYR
jgi:hypothetical protein